MLNLSNMLLPLFLQGLRNKRRDMYSGTLGAPMHPVQWSLVQFGYIQKWFRIHLDHRIKLYVYNTYGFALFFLFLVPMG